MQRDPKPVGFSNPRGYGKSSLKCPSLEKIFSVKPCKLFFYGTKPSHSEAPAHKQYRPLRR